MRWTALALLPLAIACGEGGPPEYPVHDAGDDWAPWPPLPGDAGFRLVWSVEGALPTAGSCAAIDLDRVSLSLVHPVADFETWTAPDMTASCEDGEIVRAPQDGVAAGRYRFKVELLHEGGEQFQHDPTGEAVLVAGEITTLGAVNVTAATAADGGVPFGTLEECRESCE